MAWSVSATFREWNKGVNNAVPTGYTGLSTDTVKGALFNNTTAPDKDAVVGSTGFNTGTWTTTNEVTDATNWTSTGRALASKTFTTPSTGVFMFDAADLAGAGNVTISNAYGLFVYDDSISAGTVADQGICYIYFGGPAAVTAGTFTVQFAANGIARWSS